MNYLKLDREFTIKQYSRGNLQREYGIDSPLGFRGMRYYDLTVDGDIYEAIPDCDVDECNISLLDINYKIPPHSDDVRLVINFYINTTKCITQFYYPSDFHSSDTGDVIFYEPNLEKNDRFMAYSGDAYLLDVSTPHAILPFEPGPVNRKCISMTLPYDDMEQAAQVLKSTGCFADD